MPELPQVETIRRGLSKNIVGKTIAAFASDTPKMLNHPQAFYRRALAGKKILRVGRRAKMLIFELSQENNLLFHLKMTGQLVYQGRNKCIIGGHPIKEGFQCAQNRFTHGEFVFSDKTHLFFNDVRKFGWIRLYSHRQLSDYLDSLGLGPEPLEKEFSLGWLKRALARRPKAKLKPWLMDPKNVVGIGNIYSDEICFYAKVRPDRRLRDLTEKEIAAIYRGTKIILKEAIKYEGTSISDYVNAAGEAGAYTKKLKVYQRYGKNCFKCRGQVAKIRLGGRTGSFCPHCQK